MTKNDIGRIAGPDDIAPQGTEITQAHVDTYRANVEAAHQAAALPTEGLWKD